MTGLRELLDYMYLVKSNGKYLHGTIPIYGLLCTDDINSIDENSKEPIVQLITPTRRDGLVLH